MASNVSLTTAEDTAGTTTLQGTDAEGDALTYSIVAAPNAAYGTALITGNKVTFTPNANWNGTTSFTYRANDGELNSNIATVNVTVTPVNDAPVASNVSLTTAEDTAGTATLLGSDVDGDALTYSIVTAPNADHGTVSITGNKATFTPKANWNGTTSFTYRASDGELNSNTATVSVTVTPVNDAPVANNVSITTAEDTAGVATLLGTDVDGDTLTYSVVTAPNAAHGTVFISGNKVTFTPKPNWNGTTSFTYRASDGKLNSNTATVTVTVTPVNDAPVAQPKTLTTAEDTAGQVTLTATDIDSPVPTVFQIVTAPNAAHGTASITGNKLTFTPAKDWNGSTSLTYRAQDSDGAWSAPATVNITVTPVNDAPVASNVSLTTAEDTAGTATLLGTDIDGDALTYSIVAAPNAAHGTVSITGNKVTFTPKPNWNGTTSFTYRASDGKLNSNTATVSVTVTPVNDAPTVSNRTHTMDEDTTATITLPVTDVDLQFEGDSHTWSIVTAPDAAHGTATISGDKLTFKPKANWNGTATLTYRARDSKGANSNTATVTITVRPVNDVPTVSNLTHSMDEDTTATITLPVTDVDLQFEGDSHTWSIVTAPNPAHGSASISGDKLTFTPKKDWNGTSTLTYRATDSKGANSNTGTVTIIVRPVNDAPVASNVSLATAEDSAGTVSLVGTDVDGDDLTYSIVAAPNTAHGTVTVSGNKATFTPAANWNGSTSFTYRANDGKLNSNVATVSVTVTPVNDAPSVPNLTHTMDEDTTATITLPVADVDLQFEGDSHTWSIVTAPDAAHGTATISGDKLTFKPKANWNGTATLTYRATDSKGDSSNTATVTITVRPVNDVPTVSNLTHTMDEDTTATITLPVTDVDLSFEGDSHTWSIVTAPNAAHGTATISGDKLTFKPKANWNGTATLTYRAQDSRGANSNTATVTFTVRPVNDAPVVTDLAHTMDEDTTATITLPVTDVDLQFEGDSHTWSIVTAPDAAHGTATISGDKLTFKPKANWNGTATLTYHARDSKGANSNTATVTITVRPVNDVPTVSNLTHTMDEDTTATITLPVTDVDLQFEGDSHTWSIVTAPNPAHGSASISGDKLTFKPTPNWNGRTTLTYRARDSKGVNSNTATVAITVRPVNDAPVVTDLAHTMDEDTSATITLPVADVDLQFEGDRHTWHIVEAPNPDKASVSITGDKLRVTPAPDWFGTLRITYQALDSRGAKSNVGVITVEVLNVNDAPVVQPLTLEIPEDTVLEHRLKATDIDSDPPFFFEIITPSGGAVDDSLGQFELDEDILTFVPTDNANGTVQIQYRAQDDDGEWSELETITITIVGVNDAPIATGAAIFVNESQVAAPVIPWVVDVDSPYGDTHTFAIGRAPSHGTVEVVDGALVYTPSEQYVGRDTFTIIATDSAGESIEGDVAVEVMPFNYAPTDILPSTLEMYAGVGGSATLTVIDSNLWDRHTLVVVEHPENGLVTIEGMSMTYWTDSSEDAVVRIRAVDANGLSVEKNIHIVMQEASEMLKDREIHMREQVLKLPAINVELYSSLGQYPLVITEKTALSEIGDDIVVLVDKDSEVGVKLGGRDLAPGQAMRFSPHILTQDRLETGVATTHSGQAGNATLYIYNADLTRDVYGIPLSFWTLEGALTSTNGWELMQGTQLSKVTLNTVAGRCSISTSQTSVTRRNLLDDPHCYVTWEFMPNESRDLSLLQSLSMEVVGAEPGPLPVVANAFVYDNEGNEHLIGRFEQEITVLPVHGTISTTLQPNQHEAYQGVQDMTWAVRSDSATRSCDLTSYAPTAMRQASSWAARPTCLVEWTNVPVGLSQPENWGNPQLRGAFAHKGENIIKWSTFVFTPAGQKILVNEHEHSVNVVAPPPIEIVLPELPSRLSDDMYAVPTTGGYVGNAAVHSISADVNLKTTRNHEVLRDDIILSFGRPVQASAQIVAAEAPLWSVTPFTIQARYAQLPEVATVANLNLVATPPSSIIPVITNDEKTVVDSDDYFVTAQIVDSLVPDERYSAQKHGDWDIRLVRSLPNGLFEPVTDWQGIDDAGKAVFDLDLMSFTHQQMRIYAEARVRSPFPEYESYRKSPAPLSVLVLNGSPLDAQITSMRLLGVAPLRATFSISTLNRVENRDVGEVDWEISYDGEATWEPVPTGKIAQRMSRVFEEGKYHVRAFIHNRHSGAVSVTPTVEVHAFHVPDARLKGPQNIFVGSSDTFHLLTPDGNPLDPEGLDIEWSRDRGNTWEHGGSTYSLTSDKAERLHLEVRIKNQNAPDHRLAYKRLRAGVAFRPIRPPRVQIIGPRRPEIGTEAMWTANMMMPYNRMSLTMDGFFILPDGTEVMSKEVKYTPTQEDFDREKSYITFDGWIHGYENVGGRGLTQHRLTFWSYDWPAWLFNVKHSAIYAPADVTVSLRNLGFFRDFEGLNVEWVMPETDGIEITRATNMMSRSFTVHEPGVYTIGAHVSDSRGHYSYVETDLEYFQPPEWGVDLSWSGNNPYNRAPLSVLIRPRFSGGHPRDRIEVKQYAINGEDLPGTGNYGRAILGDGTHEVTMRIETQMGYQATGMTTIPVEKNKLPVCNIAVTETRSSWRATAECSDEDGRISSYRWWINGELQAIKSRVISVPHWRYPDAEPVITLVGVDDSGGESPPVAQK